MIGIGQNLRLIALLATSAVGTVRCDVSSLDVRRARPSNDSALIPSSRAKEGPLLQGKAAGVVSPFHLTGRNLREAVITHPYPEVWLAFAVRSPTEAPRDAPSDDNAAALRVELPPEAKRVLQSQWGMALAANYDLEFGGITEAGVRAQHSVTIINSSMNAALELRKILIDAPDGRRPISHDEADDLARFIGASAFDVIKQAQVYDANGEP